MDYRKIKNQEEHIQYFYARIFDFPIWVNNKTLTNFENGEISE